MKILIVEDDKLVSEALVAVLSNQNYVVEIAYNGLSAWELIENVDYDLLLLDVMLPEIDGISLCRKIRAHGRNVPILVLTGRDSSHEKAVALDAGADDYLVKPFDCQELVARVRALLRRGIVTLQPVLEWGKLRLDPTSCEVSYDNQLVSLTPKEYALLELFLRNSRRVFSCSMILEHLWSYEDTPGEEAVRTHIKGLRHKLKQKGAKGSLIETVYGIGYRLKPLLESSGSKQEDMIELETNSVNSTSLSPQENINISNVLRAQKDSQRISLALEAAEIGIWDWNILTDQIIWSETHERLFGMAPGSFDETFYTFINCVIVSDRQTLYLKINQARLERTKFHHEFRIIWLDSSIHWIEAKGRFYYNDAGEAVRMLGTVADVSVRKTLEANLRQSKEELETIVAECTNKLIRVAERAHAI